MAPSRLLIAAFFLSLGSCLCATGVWASCGDWLAHPEGVESRAKAAPQARPFGPAPVAPPCDGPLCRQAPHDSAPPAPLRILSSDREVCCLGEEDAPRREDDRFLTWRDSGLHPSRGFPRSIDRPPRA